MTSPEMFEDDYSTPKRPGERFPDWKEKPLDYLCSKCLGCTTEHRWCIPCDCSTADRVE